MAGVDNLLAALTIKIGAQTSDFEQALARSTNKLKDFGSGVNRDLSRAFQTFDATSRKLEQGIGRVGDAMQNAGANLTLGLTAPLAAVGGMAIRSAADFQQMSNVLQAQSSASAADMARVSEVAKQLGADITLPGTSATDALAAITELSKGGLTLAQSMDSARGTIQLASAAQISNAQAAIYQVNALSAFNLQATEAARVADLLTGAANQSSSSITGIADGFQAGAAVAKMAGLSIEEFTTSLAALSNAGIKGSDAGTSIKSMLMALLSPSDKAAKKLDQIGVSIFDAQGKMKPFKHVLTDFNAALKGLTDEAKADVMGTIFGSDGIRAAEVLFKSGPEGFAKLESAVSKAGQAAELAGAQNKGFNGAIDAAKSSIQTFLQGAAEPFLGMLENMVRGVAEFFAKLDALPAPVKGVIAVVATLAAAIGPLLLALGTIASIIPTVVAGVSTLGVVFAAATGPIGLAVAALVAGVAAVAAISASVSSQSNGATEAFKKQAATVSALTGTLNPLLTRYEELKGKATLTATEQEELKKVIQEVGKAVPTAIAGFDEYGRALDINSGKAREFVKQQQAILAIKNKEAISEQVDNLETLNRKIGDVQKKLKSGIGFTQFGLGGVKTEFKLTGDEITKLQAKLADLQNQRLGTEGLIKELKGVKDAAIEAAAEVKAPVAPLPPPAPDLNPVNAAAKEAADLLARINKQISDADKKASVFGETFDLAKEKVNILTGGIGQLIEAGFKPAGRAVQGFKDMLDGISLDSVKTAVAGLATVAAVGITAPAITVDVNGKLRKVEQPDGPVKIETVIDLKPFTQKDFGLNVLQDVAKQFKISGEEAKAFGSSYDSLSERTNILKSSIQKLITEGFTMQSPVLQALVGQYNTLIDAQQRNIDLTGPVTQAAQATTDAFLDFAVGLATGADNATNLARGLFESLGNIMINLGKTALTAGLGIAAIKKALVSLNPAVALAAGAALIGFGALIKNAVKGTVSGGGGASGGGGGGGRGSSSGSAPAPSAPSLPRTDTQRNFSPARTEATTGRVEVFGEVFVDGQKLRIVLDNADKLNNRSGAVRKNG